MVKRGNAFGDDVAGLFYAKTGIVNG